MSHNFFRIFEPMYGERAHLLSSEYENHVYAKAFTLTFSFQELGDEVSLVGIVAIFPE